ncbi:MAG: 6-carboxytetrahydropterin synthase [Acidimicrobiales bacterium]
MILTITAAIHARWGHRVDGLIHTHAWTVEATIQGPEHSSKIFPADDLERILTDTVAPWTGHYLTHEDVGEWKGFQPLVWSNEPTVEEVVRQLWNLLEPQLPGLTSLSLVESTEFDRCRKVTLSKEMAPSPA